MVFDIFDKYGIENCEIILLENYPCSSKDELHAREGYYIKVTKCVKKNIAGRTKKEYYEDTDYSKKYRERNKQSIAENNKKYREDNRVIILEKKKKSYEKNKETIMEKQRKYRDKIRQEEIRIKLEIKFSSFIYSNARLFSINYSVYFDRPFVFA